MHRMHDLCIKPPSHTAGSLRGTAGASCMVIRAWRAHRKALAASAAATNTPDAAVAAIRELPPWPSQQFKRTVNPMALAYLGDAVWTLYIKKLKFAPPKHINLYHAAVKEHVTAEGQAVLCTSLLARESPLNDAERQLIGWVRACPNIVFRKRFATNEQLEVYRSATALEALVGYLHVSDPARLRTCMEFLGAVITGHDQ